MSKDELLEILCKVYTNEISADDAHDLIWGEPFEGETKYKSMFDD